MLMSELYWINPPIHNWTFVTHFNQEKQVYKSIISNPNLRQVAESMLHVVLVEYN